MCGLFSFLRTRCATVGSCETTAQWSSALKRFCESCFFASFFLYRMFTKTSNYVIMIAPQCWCILHNPNIPYVLRNWTNTCGAMRIIKVPILCEERSREVKFLQSNLYWVVKCLTGPLEYHKSRVVICEIIVLEDYFRTGRSMTLNLVIEVEVLYDSKKHIGGKL